MADNLHNVKKTLRLTKKEARELAGKSKEAQMYEADYLRFLLSQKPNDYPEIRQLLKDLINAVNAIGNNINQITRNYNSKFYSEEDKELLKAYMKKPNIQVGQIMNGIKKNSRIFLSYKLILGRLRN